MNNAIPAHPDAVKELSPIDKAFQELGNEQAETERLIEQLGRKLAPILRPGGIAAAPKGDTPRPVRAPFEDLVLNTAAFQGSFNADLRDLLDRLAL